MATKERIVKTTKCNLFRHLKSEYSDIYRSKFQLILWPDCDLWDWSDKNVHDNTRTSFLCYNI
jgi:hypothetical protein